MTEILTKEMQNNILTNIGRTIQLRAKQLCPIDEGTLRNSITYKIEGDTVIIYSPLDYAKDMEYGKPPNPLGSSEKEDVEKWAKRHGLKSGRGVIKGIETKGIKVGTPANPIHITSLGRNSYRPFLRPALLQSISVIEKNVKEALK
jgi:hypothetical protein